MTMARLMGGPLHEERGIRCHWMLKKRYAGISMIGEEMDDEVGGDLQNRR